MKTRQTALYGILAVILTPAFAALFMAGCEQPTDSPAPTLTGITAVYTGTEIIYTSTPLNNLKTGLTVTAAYDNSTTQTVTDYALSGTLAVGTSAVTVTYKGKTTTFTVTVTAVSISDITYTAIQNGGIDSETDSNGIVFTFSESVDSFDLTAADITVGGTAAKGSAELTGSGTSWTLPITVSAAGQATVEITKTGIEAGTKNVTVYKAEQIAPILTGITAIYTGTETIYPTTPLNNLKTGLTVTAAYDNSTTQTITDYTLSGTLAVGTSVVTVTYQGKITTFAVTVTAPAETPDLSGTDLEFELNDAETEYRVSKSPTTSGAVNIPALYNGLPVTSISNYAFNGCVSLTSVIIPTSVTSIGEEAFNGCDNLASVTIPNSVTSIGRSAFHDCTSLIEITIPNKLTSIGSYDDDFGVFEGCTSLASVTIPDGVLSIGAFAFGNCTSLTVITIPDTVTSIGDFAFYDCTGITSIIIPVGITSVGEQVFYEWISSQTINVRGYASQSAADSAWGSDWRDVCDAVIKYWNGSSYQ